MKTKMSKIVSVLLCLVMLLGMFQMTALAATSEREFSFEVDKNVVQGGDVAPGKESFTFELVYGTIDENEQHSVVFTPDESVTLEALGIKFTTDTITTNGAGEQTFTLGGTIDLAEVGQSNYWQFGEGNRILTLRLTEKNEGKAGWTYSDVERYLTITVENGYVYTDVHILGNDVSDNDFENIYTANAAPVRDTVTIVIGNNEKPEEANPNTGAPVFVGVAVGALAAAK